MTEAESIAADLRADGQEMILSRSAPGEFDPVAGTSADEIVQSWEVYGITANYNSVSRLASQNQPGTVIQSGDKKAIIGATVEPVPGDTLAIGGRIWRVIAVDELSPQGEALLYTCQVRR
jgi:hypothetical protein